MRCNDYGNFRFRLNFISCFDQDATKFFLAYVCPCHPYKFSVIAYYSVSFSSLLSWEENGGMVCEQGRIGENTIISLTSKV